MSLSNKTDGISWQFSDQHDGSFYIEDANHLPVLYFPLMNSKGMKSFVTPVLKGDICKDFNHYLKRGLGICDSLLKGASSAFERDTAYPLSIASNFLSKKKEATTSTNPASSSETPDILACL